MSKRAEETRDHAGESEAPRLLEVAAELPVEAPESAAPGFPLAAPRPAPATAATVDRDARSLVRALFDSTDVRSALHHAARVYAMLAGGTVKLEVAATTTHAARVRIYGSSRGRGACLTALGFFRRAAELASGERTAASEIRCCAWGDDCCEFAFHYVPERKA